MKKEKHEPYFNLFDAFKEPGCPICFLLKKNIHKLMDDFLYESVNDPVLRKEIRSSQGFCNRHAWQLQKFGDGFSQAIIYSDLMDITLKKIGNVVSAKKLLKEINLGTNSKQLCMFCGQEKDTEERYISVLWESFDDPEFHGGYKDSFGLCLPHIVFALKRCKDKKSGKELIEIEAAKLSNLAGELKEFMRKHDYRFSQQKIGAEGNSWIRAIEKFIGKEDIH